MGITRFFQSMFDSRVCGQEVVATQEKMYEQSRCENPGEEPHAHLARVWLSRARVHGKDPNDPAVQMVSFTETMQFACIPYPGCIRALGLYMVYKERPDIIQQHPEFTEEFAALIEPVQGAMVDGSMMTLYARQNPRMAAELDEE